MLKACTHYNRACDSVAVEVEGDNVLINFDGWTSRYDYWTTTDSKDLHPIGYMEQRMKYHRDYVQKLQPPKSKYTLWLQLLKQCIHDAQASC